MGLSSSEEEAEIGEKYDDWWRTVGSSPFSSFEPDEMGEGESKADCGEMMRGAGICALRWERDEVRPEGRIGEWLVLKALAPARGGEGKAERVRKEEVDWAREMSTVEVKEVSWGS
jgi:hypothetical protein